MKDMFEVDLTLINNTQVNVNGVDSDRQPIYNQVVRRQKKNILQCTEYVNSCIHVGKQGKTYAQVIRVFVILTVAPNERSQRFQKSTLSAFSIVNALFARFCEESKQWPETR